MHHIDTHGSRPERRERPRWLSQSGAGDVANRARAFDSPLNTRPAIEHDAIAEPGGKRRPPRQSRLMGDAANQRSAMTPTQHSNREVDRVLIGLWLLERSTQESVLDGHACAVCCRGYGPMVAIGEGPRGQVSVHDEGGRRS